MIGDTYNVLPLPVKIGEEMRKQNPRFKSFVAVYFPTEMLAEMKWSKETRLKLTIEKDGLKITQNESESEDYYTNELIYVPLEDEI